VNKVHFRCNNRHSQKYSGNVFFFCLIIFLGAINTKALEQNTTPKPSVGHFEDALIVTQIPPASYPSTAPTAKKTFVPSGNETFFRFGEGARLIKVYPDSTLKELSRNFHSACDPAISFDASHILFAGKRTAGDDWNIY
jgi:hypothetical protein